MIAAAAGGPLDLVHDGRNGLLWHGGDPRELAAQVESLRDDRARLAQLAFRARPSVVRRTWERVTGELLDHYSSVVTARPSGIMSGGPAIVGLGARSWPAGFTAPAAADRHPAGPRCPLAERQ